MLSLPDAAEVTVLADVAEVLPPPSHTSSSLLSDVAADLPSLGVVDERVVSARIVSATDDVASCLLGDGSSLMLPVSEFYPDRRWRVGDEFQALLVSDGSGRLSLSTARPELVELLFASVVPEIRRGLVRVMGVSRVPGVRAKVAVACTGGDDRLDPVAACIGRRANRVRFVVDALLGERVDIVAWHADRSVFLANALAPAEVSHVAVSGSDAMAFVPSHQMPAAVGRGGLNSVLAGQLVGFMVTVSADENRPAVEDIPDLVSTDMVPAGEESSVRAVEE